MNTYYLHLVETSISQKPKKKIIWIDDVFFGIANESSLNLEKLQELAKGPVICEEIAVINPDTNKEIIVKRRVSGLVDWCKQNVCDLIVGHFMAMDKLFEEHKRNPDAIFLFDLHNSDSFPTIQKNKRYIGSEWLRSNFEWFTTQRHRVAYWTRLASASNYDSFFEDIMAKPYPKMIDASTIDSLNKAIEWIEGIMEPIEWFLHPPNARAWFFRDEGHNPGLKAYDECMESLQNAFPSYSWVDKDQEAKALLFSNPDNNPLATNVEIDPACIKAIFGEQLSLGDSLKKVGNAYLPIKPAFPFLCAVRHVFKVVSEEYKRHGEPYGIACPSGKWKFDLSSDGRQYLAMEYAGSEKLAKGVKEKEKKGNPGELTIAVQRARIGKFERRDAKNYENNAIKALSGVHPPIAEELAENGWFGIAWPPDAKDI